MLLAQPGGQGIQAASPVDDVVNPVLWTMLTSSKSDLGDVEVQAPTTSTSNKAIRQCYRHCKGWGDRITTRRCTCNCI
jgi:hypothetical protein